MESIIPSDTALRGLLHTTLILRNLHKSIEPGCCRTLALVRDNPKYRNGIVAQGRCYFHTRSSLRS